jgi:23S rRNA (guanine745-N1)-methyltransferase
MCENPHKPALFSREQVFGCPVCGQALLREDKTFRCWQGHVFDVARQGYANLLLAQHRRSKDPGYSREMIAARETFLQAGHYQPLADAVADAIISYLPDSTDPVVVDAGCGEGYYLRRLHDRLVSEERQASTIRCGIDISKHAIRVASRRDPSGLYAVGGTYRLPVLPDRVDVVLSHFSPVSAADFRRVVRRNGVVLIGSPGEDHLYSLKQLLYDTPTLHEPRPPLAGETDFELVNTHRVRYHLSLKGLGDVASLLAMTPYYWSTDQATQARLAQLEALDTGVDVIVHAYRRTGNGGNP